MSGVTRDDARATLETAVLGAVLDNAAALGLRSSSPVEQLVKDVVDAVTAPQFAAATRMLVETVEAEADEGRRAAGESL